MTRKTLLLASNSIQRVHPEENWIMQLTFDADVVVLISSRHSRNRLRTCAAHFLLYHLCWKHFFQISSSCSKNLKYLSEPASTHLLPAGWGAEMKVFLLIFDAVGFSCSLPQDFIHIQPSLLLDFQLWESDKKIQQLSRNFFSEPAVRCAGPISTSLPHISFCWKPARLPCACILLLRRGWSVEGLSEGSVRCQDNLNVHKVLEMLSVSTACVAPLERYICTVRFNIY